MRELARIALVAVALVLVSRAQAQTQGAKTDGEIKTEEAQAQALSEKQNFIAALPLYEDLHAERPQSLMYEERLAFCVLASTAQQTPDAAASEKFAARCKRAWGQQQSVADIAGAVEAGGDGCGCS